MQNVIDETKLKSIIKEAIKEVVEENNEAFTKIITDIIEDIGLSNAIKEGENSETVEPEEIFKILESQSED